MVRAASLVGPAVLMPAVLLPLAAALATMRTLPDPLTVALHAVPLAVFGGGAVVGFVLRRGRLMLGLVTLALVDCGLVYLSGRAVLDAVALLLPLNVAIIAWLPEANPLGGAGAVRLAVTLLQAGVVAVLQVPALSTLAVSLPQPLVAADSGSWTALPQAALVSFALALLAVLARFVVSRQPFAAGSMWALVASYLALDVAYSGASARIHFATAGLLLLVGAARDSGLGTHVDSVTGLPASLELNKTLRRLPRRYALARVEIDDFAAFRETHGVEAASRMLRVVATALAKVGGGGRVYYLLRGHAFIVVFRRKAAKVAGAYLNVIRREIEAASVDVAVPDRQGAGRAIVRTVSVTISAGVAEARERGVEAHQVLREAERALERARESGFNRVIA